MKCLEQNPTHKNLRPLLYISPSQMTHSSSFFKNKFTAKQDAHTSLQAIGTTKPVYKATG